MPNYALSPKLVAKNIHIHYDKGIGDKLNL
jgi:hypothetical protein